MPLIGLRLLGGVEVSVHGDGREHRLSVAPKPLALLAYLAVSAAEDMPVRRDVLLALFWPELPTDRGRGALRQLLFQLRRVIGDAAIHGNRETIAIAPDAVSCDVMLFARRLAQGDRAGAMEVYRGPLLDGFFVDGTSAAFEEWMFSARARLNDRAFAACTALADAAQRASNGIAAAQWARAAATLAPDDEIAVRRLIQTLDAFGDRCGALRAADDFSRRLSIEFDATPSAETQTLIEAIRARRSTPIRGVRTVEPVAAESTALSAFPVVEATPARVAPSPSTGTVRRRSASWRWRGSLVGAAAVSAIAVGFLVSYGRNAAAGARSYLRASPPITIAGTTARGLYEQGMDRYYAGDPRESARLFKAALDRDSNCAMCALYASLAEGNINDVDASKMIETAHRLAPRVSEPERMLIRYRWADATNSGARRAIGDSLVARYPDWTEAQIAAAEAAEMQGAWLAAADHLRRAIAGAPRPSESSTAACVSCATRLVLITTYQNADSSSAALRVARELEREHPRWRLAWLQLAHLLTATGHYDEARAAIDSATRYSTGTEADVIEHAMLEMRARNFVTADRMLTALAQTGNADKRSDAFWFLIISLRTQGRLHEALALSQGGFHEADSALTHTVATARVAEAQVRFELGQFRQAADIFESLVVPPDTFSRAAAGRSARQRVWVLTHAGSALAAEGDTIALARLEDTLQVWGPRSGFGRDRLLHDYLRGLLWTARNRPDSALAAFGRATFSETEGFSRIDLQRARALLALGRPAEAIPILRHPLAGSLEAGNFYTTQTELQELLARAFESAGELDSAAVYYRYVVTAWSRADAQFQPRVAHDRERIAVDERLLRARRAQSTVASSP